MGDNIIQSASYNYGDLPRETIEQLRQYPEGRKVAEDIHAKGGDFLFHISEIKEQDPVKSWFKRKRKPYRWNGNVGISLFNPDGKYTDLMDVFTKNPPVVTLADRTIMVPENSLFDDLYSGLCEAGLGDGTSSDDILECYVKAIGSVLWFAYLSRATEKGFIKNITIIDIETGV